MQQKADREGDGAVQEGVDKLKLQMACLACCSHRTSWRQQVTKFAMLHMMCAPCLLHAQAIREDYYFQMYYDDLPIWGFIGKLEKEVVSSSPGDSRLKHYLFTHVHFDIAFNGQHIVEINVSTDPAQVVSADSKIRLVSKVLFMQVSLACS